MQSKVALKNLSNRALNLVYRFIDSLLCRRYVCFFFHCKRIPTSIFKCKTTEKSTSDWIDIWNFKTKDFSTVLLTVIEKITLFFSRKNHLWMENVCHLVGKKEMERFFDFPEMSSAYIVILFPCSTWNATQIENMVTKMLHESSIICMCIIIEKKILFTKNRRKSSRRKNCGKNVAEEK